MSDVATFDPMKCIPAFLGNILLDFEEDTLISLEPSGEDFSYHPGIGKSGTRAFNTDESWIIRLMLQLKSPSNDILWAIRQLDKRLKNQIGAFVFQDLNGTTELTGPETWIVKAPTIEYGKEPKSREWVFRTTGLVGTLGHIL